MTVRVTDTFWHLRFFSTVTFEFEVTQGGFEFDYSGILSCSFHSLSNPSA